jgi:hypothetical protein
MWTPSLTLCDFAVKRYWNLCQRRQVSKGVPGFNFVGAPPHLTETKSNFMYIFQKFGESGVLARTSSNSPNTTTRKVPYVHHVKTGPWRLFPSFIFTPWGCGQCCLRFWSKCCLHLQGRSATAPRRKGRFDSISVSTVPYWRRQRISVHSTPHPHGSVGMKFIRTWTALPTQFDHEHRNTTYFRNIGNIARMVTV